MNLVKIGRVIDMIADRQTNTHSHMHARTHTRTVITILRSLIGGSNNNVYCDSYAYSKLHIFDNKILILLLTFHFPEGDVADALCQLFRHVSLRQ